jgi:uncharacterized protein (DUF1778 family)
MMQVGPKEARLERDNVRRDALDVLPDRRAFNLNAAASDTFARALATPIEPNDALRNLMGRNSPWE